MWYIAKTSDQMIEGAASTAHLDDHGTVLDPLGMQCDELPLSLCWRHRDVVGEVVYLRKTSHVVFMRGIVHDHQAHIWREIQSGELRSLSVELDELESERCDGYTLIRSWRLRHVSICAAGGSNPEAKFYPYVPAGRRPVRL